MRLRTRRCALTGEGVDGCEKKSEVDDHKRQAAIRGGAHTCFDMGKVSTASPWWDETLLPAQRDSLPLIAVVRGAIKDDGQIHRFALCTLDGNTLQMRIVQAQGKVL